MEYENDYDYNSSMSETPEKITETTENLEIPISLQIYGGLSRQTIQNIINQKASFYRHQKNINSEIWHDSDFVPGPLLDKISDHIAEEIAGQVAENLDEICDQFIDCLVHSEFFPEDIPS